MYTVLKGFNVHTVELRNFITINIMLLISFLLAYKHLAFHEDDINGQTESNIFNGFSIICKNSYFLYMLQYLYGEYNGNQIFRMPQNKQNGCDL